MTPDKVIAGANIGASLGASLNGGWSNGGSTSTSAGANSAQNSSYSRTYGYDATSSANAAADIAYDRQKELLRLTQEYNAKEAKKQRDWQEKMASETYQRSMKDMLAAGLNPVLAAGMGLGASSVGSGTSASVGVPSSQMSAVYPESISSAQGTSEGWNQSNGHSWEQSEYGLATALKQMGELIGNAIDTKTAAVTVNNTIDGLGDWAKNTADDIKKQVENFMGEHFPNLGQPDKPTSSGGGHTFKKSWTDLYKEWYNGPTDKNGNHKMSWLQYYKAHKND